MKYDRFVETRRPRWERLESLLSEVKKQGLERLPAGHIEELGTLYRHSASDLAIARRDIPEDRVTAYLDSLVARAYAVIYRDPPAGSRDVGYFVRYGFPAAYRRTGPYTGICVALFFGAAFVSAVLVTVKSSLADILLPGQAQGLRGVMAHHHLWVQSATERHSVAASFIMTNNIAIALSAFAFGMLAAVPTVWIMLSNGINLGATAALVAQYHLSLQLWSFVAPHGVIELSVICASGGAGMAIGDAILRPGLRPRSQALAEAARTSAQVLIGCAALLVVAGTIEAFFSPSPAPPWLKIGVAVILFCALYGWLLGSRPATRTRSYRFEDVFQGETREKSVIRGER